MLTYNKENESWTAGNAHSWWGLTPKCDPCPSPGACYVIGMSWVYKSPCRLRQSYVFGQVCSGTCTLGIVKYFPDVMMVFKTSVKDLFCASPHCSPDKVKVDNSDLDLRVVANGDVAGTSYSRQKAIVWLRIGVARTHQVYCTTGA